MHKSKLTKHAIVAVAALLFGILPNAARAIDPSSPAKNQDPKPAEATAKSAADTKDQVSVLKEQMALQQKQIEQMQKALEEQKRLLEQLTSASTVVTPAAQPAKATVQVVDPQPTNLGQVASTTPIIPKAKLENAVIPVAAMPARSPQKSEGESESPLQLKVGSASITPVGFMDFTTVWRSKDGGSGIGTNFASIPYGSTTYQGNLSEFRLSMQNSRVGFRVDADVKGAHVIGYMESDFLGNNPTNVAVSSNSNTMRSRLYWADVRKGSWEVLGGQTWSLLTPGRSGISPLPADLFYTQNIDVNYQLGLFWGRIPEFRFVYHLPSNKAHLAFAVESPEQYVGGSAGGGLVTFPAAINTAYQGEFNIGTNTLGVPNVAPDFIAKLAVDPSKKFHFEIGGVERNFKAWVPGTTTTPAQSFSAEGGGGFANLNFELFKGLRILTANYYSDGGGRYIFGQAPDLIAHADGSLSLIHSSSTVSGFEYTKKNTVVYGYYGGLYVGRNVAIDSTGKPVGYGYTGAASGQNKSVQEGTFGINQTFWKSPKFGALTLMTQYSYLDRNPWYIAPGSPKEAHLNMIFVNLRYTLPGSAPTLGSPAK